MQDAMTSQQDHAASLRNHTPSLYSQNAAFVYSKAFVSPTLELLKPIEGERIVDLGCGSGELTTELSTAVGPSGGILGIDSASEMLEKAGKLTQNCGNVSFLSHADIQNLHENLPIDHEHAYDAVFSNAVLHWCKRDPGGVLETCRRLLRKDGKGRLVIEMGGAMNVIGIRAGLHGALRRRGIDPKPLDPWYFPNVKEYEELLRAHGFEPISVTLHPRPTPLPTDLAGWLHTFARRSFLSSLDDALAEEVIAEVVEDMRTDCQDSEGRWQVMYVRLRVSAVCAAIS